MNTINISLPEKLKEKAQELVEKGFYASFSDLVRDSIRQTVTKNKYDLWTEEALEDERKGRAVVLKTKKDIDDYFKSL
ncbi:ribbon-helix-helix protein, CopG family [Candidatus Woesebacteria bacterium]|nr:ribbon-helix-helix protein, CopG family [Candidatus Woesebacteria bacterium]